MHLHRRSVPYSCEGGPRDDTSRAKEAKPDSKAVKASRYGGRQWRYDGMGSRREGRSVKYDDGKHDGLNHVEVVLPCMIMHMHALSFGEHSQVDCLDPA